MHFPIHDLDSAPAGARPTLAEIRQSYGFIPNLAGAFAESPGALNALWGALRAFEAAEMTLSPLERQVVLLAVSARNRCEYCAAAHGMLADMNGLERREVQNLQEGRRLSDARLEALRQFAETLVDRRGWLSPGDLEKFIGAGFTRAQVFEVILGVALKTLTNYANHVAKPAVNEQFAAFLPKWAAAA